MMIKNIKRTINKILGLFPSALPQGMPEFTAWADSIIDTYELPTQDRDSVHLTLATMIMHLGAAQGSMRPDTRPKYFFVTALRNAAARQVAGAVFQEIKTRQAEAQAAAKSEATSEKKASDESQQQAI